MNDFDKWTNFYRFCQQNPYCEIQNLEIRNGAPQIVVVNKQIAPKTIAKISIKL